MEQVAVMEQVDGIAVVESPVEEPLVAEALIEEISIDGMCGVY